MPRSGRTPMLFGISAPLFRNDRRWVRAAIKRGASLCQATSPELRNAHSSVLAAVQQWGANLAYASLELRGDREIVLTALASNPPSFRYASPQLRADRDIVLSVIGSCSHILEEVGVQLRDDRESVSLLAIEQDSSALELAIAELQNEFAIVRAAVRKRRVVVAVCQCRLAERRNDCPGRGQIKCISGPRSCQFCYARLCEPIARSFSLPSANTTRRVTVKASPELQDDPQIVVAAIKTYPRATQGAGVHAKGTPARLFSL